MRYEQTSDRSPLAYWGKGGCDQYFSEQNSDPIRVEFYSLEHTSTNKICSTEGKSVDAGPGTLGLNKATQQELSHSAEI